MFLSGFAHESTIVITFASCIMHTEPAKLSPLGPLYKCPAYDSPAIYVPVDALVHITTIVLPLQMSL